MENLTFNTDTLKRQTFNDADVMKVVLELFLEQMTGLVPRICACESGYRELAHTLKGAALGVGAEELAAVSAAIEDSPSELSDQARSELETATQKTLDAVNTFRNRLGV